jgi:hypothetical protein
VNIGDVDDDDDGGEEGVVVLDDVIDPQVDSDNEKEGIQSDTYINVGKNIEHFFGLPMVVEDREGHVRGCAIFTQLTADEIENEYMELSDPKHFELSPHKLGLTRADVSFVVGR